MPRLSESQRIEVLTRYKEGEISSHLAKIYNVDRSSIDSLVRRRGLTAHSKSYVFRTASGHCLDESVFNFITEESAYWIGFLMADGAIVNNTVALVLQEKDLCHLEKFKMFVGGTQKIIKNASTNSYRYAFESPTIVNKLNLYNVTANKSHTAIGSTELINNRHFWRGMVDGDGHLGLHQHKNRNKPTLRLELVGSFDMVKQFLEFVNQNIAQTKVQICKDKSVYRVQFSCSTAKGIAKILYANSKVYLDRKQAIALIFANTNVVKRGARNFSSRSG